ncbi:prolyl oligopeptidase family serine peptidase [Lysobacter sp. F6437]|uniref:prolyl oligopeptidase family serine peptidase n=1 Tax=Lysobacter sp. F6437 TaxID=3459296 RepID=UPI00403E3018
MNTSTIRRALHACCFTLLASATAQAAEPIPIEDFARVPAIQSVSMSSDGKNLVAIVASPGSDYQETALATWKLDDLGAGSTITPSGDRMKFVGASALKADKVFVLARQEWTGQLGGCGEGKTTGATKTFVYKAYLTDTAQGDFNDAFADNTRTLGISQQTQRCLEIAGTASLVHALPLDPERVIVSQLNELTLSANYYLYNLRTDKKELLFKAGGRSSPGLFDPRTGELLTRTQIESAGPNDYEQQILIRNQETGEFEEHETLTKKITERYTIDIVGKDDASGKFYVLTDLFSDRVEARMYDPRTRKFDDEPLAAHPEFSISRLILGTQPSNFNRVLGFVVDGPQPKAVYVDPSMKAIQDALEQAYPGQSIGISGYNDDLSRVLFSASSAQHPPSYHILVDKKQDIALGSARPWIDPSRIGQQKWVSYTARDGRKIPALLDLPVGWKQGDPALPAIVQPHGGPWSRDHGGWDRSGWVPFLTSRGYAVLRPQYRGSTGLGRDLWIAGDSQWGLAMQDDNDDGAKWLVSQGVADPERIAIFGYSYGGFAASAAVVRDDSPYQCAIAGAPVTDLGRLGTSWSDNRLQRILQADTVKGMDPMLNTDNAQLPVLLYVGDRDVRTPSFHARGFYDAVREKVPARFELIPDMPHSMPWYPRHHQKTLSVIEKYLSEECGPGGL